jgi:hypothetical protein
MPKRQSKRYIFQVSLNEEDMNSLWIPMQKRYNTDESKTWRMAGKDALLLAEITEAAMVRGVSDPLKYFKNKVEESKK